MDGTEPADLMIHLPVSRDRAAARVADPAPAPGRRLVDDPGDLAAAAAALRAGAVVGHPFANVYALTSRPDAATVRSVNLLAGRPPRQVGSVTTTPMRLPLLLDRSRLPLAGHAVLGLLDALLGLGPIGVRGPAAAGVPGHVTQVDGGVRTVRVLSPGLACPSTDFLARALHAAGTELLAVTVAGRSRRLPVAGEQPAHRRAAGLRTDFGDDPRFLLLEHRDERDAQARYPAYAPVAPTVLTLPTVPATGRRPRLVLERHGSLTAERVRDVIDGFGFDLVPRPHAWHPLPPRRYAAVGA